MGRIETARRVFRTNGLNGVLAAFKDRYLSNRIGDQIDWCYGRLIEMRGNQINIDGCAFSLDSPAITTRSKGKFMFDRYERPERSAIHRFVDPDLPVVELGGSIGVVSCLTNRKLSKPQRHIVVEANPVVVPLLIENRKSNGCQFSVVSKMIGYDDDHMSFFVDKSNFVVSSSLPANLNDSFVKHDVPTTNLRSIIDENGFEMCTLICDIEGGESDLLRHESDVLRKRVSTLILEVHEWNLGRSRVEEILRELSALGFETKSVELDTHTFQKHG